jgi:hypothetical protein
MKSIQHDAESWKVYQREVLDLIVAALQWLAAEPEDATRYFPRRDVAASSIAQQYADAYRAGYWPVGVTEPRSAFDPPLPFEATLHAIDQAMDRMVDADWTEGALGSRPAWAEVRAAARGILMELGQPWDDSALRLQAMGADSVE